MLNVINNMVTEVTNMVKKNKEIVNIIFLDIDGVLNIMSASYNSYNPEHGLGIHAMEKHLIRRLEFIIERTSRVIPTKIVISSSWSKEATINELTKYKFKYIDSIIDRTARDKYSLRGEQIAEWLENSKSKYDIREYIVLEDEISDVCGNKCSAIPGYCVIEVDMNEGLSNTDVIESIQLLNKIDPSEHNKKVQNDKANLDYYYRLGYDTSVLNPERDKWEVFVVNQNNMVLHMKEE